MSMLCVVLHVHCPFLGLFSTLNSFVPLAHAAGASRWRAPLMILYSRDSIHLVLVQFRSSLQLILSTVSSSHRMTIYSDWIKVDVRNLNPGKIEE